MVRKVLRHLAYVPFVPFVDSPTGKTIGPNAVDFVSRLLFMQVMHKTYPVSGTICTGAAVKIPGTIVNEMIHPTETGLRIGHPAGIIEVESIVEKEHGQYILKRVAAGRTARRIMDGYVCVRRSVFQK